MEENHFLPHTAHYGIEKTYKRIPMEYYWPGMYKDITDVIHKCQVCQRQKVEQKKPMGLLGDRIVETPWTVVATDIMEPFPKSKR